MPNEKLLQTYQETRNDLVRKRNEHIEQMQMAQRLLRRRRETTCGLSRS